MDKRFSLLAGIVLLTVGALILMSNLAVSLFGSGIWRWAPWRLWPLVVVGFGVLLMALPLVVGRRRGLGALFILGVPVLTSGGLLLFSSVFDAWAAWRWLWPLEVLSTALGCLLAAVYARSLWLLVPAIVIGANGLLFQFCAVTGWWSVWSVLWTVEPLSLGLALGVLGLKRRSTALLVTSAALLVLGGAGLIGMTTLASLRTLVPGSWPLNLVGPVAIMAAGLLLLLLSLLHRLNPARVAAE